MIRVMTSHAMELWKSAVDIQPHASPTSSSLLRKFDAQEAETQKLRESEAKMKAEAARLRDDNVKVLSVSVCARVIVSVCS